jgi:hypothetical protein
LRAAQKLRKPGQDEDDSRPGKNVDLATTTMNDIELMQMNHDTLVKTPGRVAVYV